MRTMFLALLAMFVFAASAHATEPKPETVERFLDVYQFEPIREAWAFRLERDISTEIARVAATPGLNEESREAIDRYKVASSAVLQHYLSSDSLRPRYAAIFRQVFTQEEMAEVVRFYESEAGKATVRKRAQIASLMQQQFVSLSSEIADQIAPARKNMETALTREKAKR